MAYATQQDLIDEFGEQQLIQLTDLADPPAETIDAAVLARAQARADGEIDAALAGRYSLPLASVPTLLIGVACDVTRFYLYRDAMPEEVRKRYENATKMLREIAAGRLGLGLTPAGLATAGGDTATMATSQRVFGREDL